MAWPWHLDGGSCPSTQPGTALRALACALSPAGRRICHPRGRSLGCLALDCFPAAPQARCLPLPCPVQTWCRVRWPSPGSSTSVRSCPAWPSRAARRSRCGGGQRTRRGPAKAGLPCMDQQRFKQAHLTRSSLRLHPPAPSCHVQAANLGRRQLSAAADAGLKGSECLGADALLQLLKNYARR